MSEPVLYSWLVEGNVYHRSRVRLCASPYGLPDPALDNPNYDAVGETEVRCCFDYCESLHVSDELSPCCFCQDISFEFYEDPYQWMLQE